MDGELPAYAATIATQIDRVFIAGMAHSREGGGRDLVRAHGGPACVGSLIEFRTSLAWPGRVVTWPQFAAVTRYRDQAEVRGLIDANAGSGHLAVGAEGFRATDAGLAFLTALYDQQGDVLARTWGGVDDLAALAGTALDAAAATGGAAFAAMAPPYEPPGSPAALLLNNRLGTLRYHRADAHAAAWTAAGHTAASIQTLASGAARAEVEAATNRRAAAPFEALTADARRALLDALTTLP